MTSKRLLALLFANVIGSDPNTRAPNNLRAKPQLELACFYSSICDGLGKRCSRHRLFELAKLRLLERVSFARFSKLSLFKAVGFGLELRVCALTLLNSVSKRAKARLDLKRLRDNLLSLSLEA